MSALMRMLQLRRTREEVLPEVERRKTMRPTRDERAGKTRKILLGIVLWPLSLLAFIVLIELFFDAAVHKRLWTDESVWFFTAGCLAWFLLALFRVKMSIVYVFAHELTHVIATLLSGGRVHHWDATEQGGFVEASKTNWFITLAPYLVPLYTIIVLALYGCVSLFADLHLAHTVQLGSAQVQFKLAWIFHFWMGVTWAFHVVFTFDVLKTEQSDLLHNGEFFSMMLIFGWNLGVLGLLFLTASNVFSWHEAWNLVLQLVLPIWHLMETLFLWLWHLIVSLLQQLWHLASAWFVKQWHQVFG